MLKVGDLVTGAVLEGGANKIVVDLGKHGTGIIYRGEIQNARELVKNLKIGDPVHAKVVETDNSEGVVELSLTEAGRQKAWAGIKEIQDKDEVIKFVPKSFNKGGLIGELHGIQAFLPISQLGTANYPKVSTDDRTQIAAALEKLVGKEIEAKIIDVNPRTNKLIVSERAATEISLKELAKNYSVGQIIEGVVSGVADFGAFVKFTDNPEVEGLIHVSELDYKVVDNPKEIINVDDVVKAKIIDIKDGKISLSLKALKEDPWQSLAIKYKAGAVVKGSAYAYHPFGAIINLDKEIQGQIHVSEFGGVEEMKKEIVLGKEYKFTIESVNLEEKRINLKFKPAA